MCDAISVAIGAQAASTLMGVGAAKAHGAAAKAAGYQSADAAERAAADAIDRGQIKDLQAAMRVSAVVSEQTVAQSGRGADINVGGPLAVRLGSQAVGDVDRAIVRRNAALEAYGLRERARVHRQQALYAEAEASDAAMGTFLGGLGKVVGMGGKLFNDRSSNPSGEETRPEAWELLSAEGA